MRADHPVPAGGGALPAVAYVSDALPGIRRRRVGRGFAYYDAEGRLIRDAAEIRRIRALAIPPAWTEVWICPSADGHIQATGRDARGRKQYRYHARFRESRDSNKYAHILDFAAALPALRARVKTAMSARGLGRDKVIATVVHLLDTTLVRVGNRDYARANKSFGLTTLRSRHVAVEGSTLRFDFKGKSGKIWRLKLWDRRVANIVRACQDLPGQDLFRYLDEEGAPHSVTSGDVNAWLREATGAEITAKDFRTWAGTVLACMAFAELSAEAEHKPTRKNLARAIAAVAAKLGNTPAICRKCYVHPEVMEAYLGGTPPFTLEAIAAAVDGDLPPEEAAALAFLKKRLRRTATSRRAAA
ncbi:DNA topoisomerase IB [Prosthecomicrobium pneumaticum]|uniref:DNA topoisomerase n=1 Tax=Prosthecomicrobium pneumaticum TaxID=81895 RepID=A0A7W9FJP5_9HYPH|nr:DNA topoisomerase IB [Prosthecomicrobium pneumaticum]MBB5751796.1 DNA topoisomerase-1 [Prosthecomicrobium pneumaticum]